MQKIQTELRSAHNLSLMVLRREQEKSALYKAERELWEAKWKLFETKRRWPSLGMTREEEEVITGRTTGVQAATVNTNLLGRHHLQQSVPRKRLPERERDEREKRERAMEATKLAEKGLTSTGRSSAPEVLRERMAVLRQRLEEELAKKKAADLQWDDATDVSVSYLGAEMSSSSLVIVSTAAIVSGRSFISTNHRSRSSVLLHAQRRRGRRRQAPLPSILSSTQRSGWYPSPRPQEPRAWTASLCRFECWR
jgi:hypothetical protein